MKDRYLNFYIISVLMINTIAYFPFITIRSFENGFPFAIFSGFIIVSMITVILIKSYNRFEGKCLVEINRNAFGRKLGGLFTFIFAAVCFSEGCLLYISSIIMSRKIILPTTSPYLISMFILSVIACCLLNNEKTMLIIIAFFTLIIIILYPAILGITIRDSDLRLIEGAIRHSVKMPTLQLVAFSTFFFAGIENLAIYNGAFKRVRSTGPLLIYFFIGIPVAFLTILLPIGIWGDVAVKTINLPTLITNDALAVDLFLIERGLFIVFPIYFVISLVGVINYMYVSFGLLKKLVSKEKTYRAFAFLLMLLLLFLTKYSDSITSIMNFAGKWVILWFFYLLIFSLLLNIFTKKAVKK